MADVTGMQFANTVLNDYYSKIITELPADTIEYTPITTPEQTTESIAEQVRGYLQPQYESAVRERKEQTTQNQAAIDVDAASRGMTPSTWVTDSKARQLDSEASDIADLGSDYSSTLAQSVASQYENYLTRKAGIDEVNAGNQITVDQWNSQVKTALEELAYSRALAEYQRNPNGRGYTGSSGSSGSGVDTSGYLPMAQYAWTSDHASYLDVLGISTDNNGYIIQPDGNGNDDFD